MECEKEQWMVRKKCRAPKMERQKEWRMEHQCGGRLTERQKEPTTEQRKDLHLAQQKVQWMGQRKEP